MDNSEETIMKEKNWPYLAGIYDGEGCFHIARIKSYVIPGTVDSYRTGYRLDMHVTTTSLELAKYLHRTFGGNYYHVPSSSPKWRDAYRWQPSGKANKEKLILGILPYLIIKKTLAEICLEFLRLGNSNDPIRREELCQKAREHSRRGRSVETETLDPVVRGVADKLAERFEKTNQIAFQNILNTSPTAGMIQSELNSDAESAPTGTSEA